MTGWCQQDGIVVSKAILSQFDGLGLSRSLFLMDLKQPNIKELPDFYCGLLKKKGLVDHSSVYWLLIYGTCFSAVCQVVTLGHVVQLAGAN